MSGVALLDKAGWAPLGKDETHPVLIAVVGLAMIVLVPLVWGLLRREPGAADVRRADGRRARGRTTAASVSRRQSDSVAAEVVDPSGVSPSARAATRSAPSPSSALGRAADVGLALLRVVVRQGLEDQLGARAGELDHHLGQLQHRELVRVAEVDRPGERVRGVHQPHQASIRSST